MPSRLYIGIAYCFQSVELYMTCIVASSMNWSGIRELVEHCNNIYVKFVVKAQSNLRLHLNATVKIVCD